jgi:hypothetical protein
MGYFDAVKGRVFYINFHRWQVLLVQARNLIVTA